MHESVMDYVHAVIVLRGLQPKRVLDVGSLDVNGSTRSLFPEFSYVGLDGREGPGVDVVAMSWDMPFPDATFDCVVSTEMLEHDEYPERTFAEIQRVLEPGGALILTCRGPGFPLHEYPGDYYRYTVDDLKGWLQHYNFYDIAVGADPQAPGAFATAYRGLDGTTGFPPPLRPVE